MKVSEPAIFNLGLAYIDATTYVTVGDTDYKFWTSLDTETGRIYDGATESALNPYGDFEDAEHVPGVAQRAYAAVRHQAVQKLLAAAPTTPASIKNGMLTTSAPQKKSWCSTGLST